MSTTFARRMIMGAAAAVAVAILASGCGAAAKNQTPAGSPSDGPSATKKAPSGGGAAF